MLVNLQVPLFCPVANGMGYSHNCCVYFVIVAAGKHISTNSVPCSCHHISRIFQLGLTDVAHNNGML